MGGNNIVGGLEHEICKIRENQTREIIKHGLELGVIFMIRLLPIRMEPVSSLSERRSGTLQSVRNM